MYHTENTQLYWQCTEFDQLTAHELYQALQMREAVFTLEQNCTYEDMDGVDYNAHHLMGWTCAEGTKKHLHAYARIVYPDCKFPELSIGRIVTPMSVRNRGIGKELLQTALYFANRLFPHNPIKISAQRRLEGFYMSFGFETISEPYNEAGIEHVTMLRKAD